MDGSPGSSVVSDAPSEKENLEVTIDALQQKNERLKLLLIKQGQHTKSLKSKQEELENEKEALHIKLAETQGRLNKLVKYEPPKEEDIIEILARVKIDTEIYTCWRTKKGNYWCVDGTFIARGQNPEVLDNSCSKKVQAEQTANIVRQYEDRMKRLQENMDAYEEKNQTLQLAYRDLQVRYDEIESREKSRPVGLVRCLIDESAELYDKVMGFVLDDEIDNNKLNSMQKSISNFVKKPSEGDALDLREHLGTIQRSLVDITRRLLHARNELQTQEKAWRATCDALMHEKEEMKVQISRLKLEISKKQEEFQGTLMHLQQEKDFVAQEKSREIKQLQSEIKKSINVPYLKHVLIQYFCTDELDVQDRLINVLSTLLQFAPEEMTKIREHRMPKGVLTRILKW